MIKITKQSIKHSLTQVLSTSLYQYVQWLAFATVIALCAWVALFIFMYLVKTYPEPITPSQSMLDSIEFRPYASVPETGLQIAERPLFWPERRPPAAEVEAPKPPKRDVKNRNIDEFTLKGVIGAGAASTVSVSYKNKTYHMSIGDALAGWTFQDVFQDEVVFVESETVGSGKENFHSLKLYPAVQLPSHWSREKADL